MAFELKTIVVSTSSRQAPATGYKKASLYSLTMGELNSLPVTSSILLFWIFGFVNAFLDLADLLGNGNLFGTDLRALPQGLAAPGAILAVQEGNPFLRTLIS